MKAPSHDELTARLEAALLDLLTVERAAARPEGGAAETPVLVNSEHVLRLRSPA